MHTLLNVGCPLLMRVTRRLEFIYLIEVDTGNDIPREIAQDLVPSLDAHLPFRGFRQMVVGFHFFGKVRSVLLMA
jgi:hypothetical protein